MNQSQFVPLKKKSSLRSIMSALKKQDLRAPGGSVRCRLRHECDVPNRCSSLSSKTPSTTAYCPREEGGRIKRSIRKKNGKMISYRVRDNGVGMEPELLNGILNRKAPAVSDFIISTAD